ncbi:tetratricopeptide repeat protein [Neptunomonas japonica]|uniref:tetratricopeptide repeat protein n=1 Tax=Neptunomonas japonica TaxID=417574 RepID=UPI00041C8483|nr:tetratricopeptide repeat protein [Neptunomonas japonica]
MDIKLTPIALFIAATMTTTGCSADSQDASTSEYCRNGGFSTDYTCDQDKQIPDRKMIDVKALPSTDEAWMEGKLAEIKAWLQQEQEPTGTAKNISNPPSAVTPQGIAVRNPSATDPELMRIEAMSRENNHRAAMSAVNSFLATHPDSLEGKLTKSLVLNNMGQFKEAEALLKNTIARYPSSPEVYNNLAVLYAGQGDNGRAIETLLKAFSTHPTYAQVHQNLRELYATVASQAYNRALDLNEKNSAPQLVMLRRTSGNNTPALNYQSSTIVSNDTLAAIKAVPANTVAQPAPKKPVVATPPITKPVAKKPVVAKAMTEVPNIKAPVIVEASTPVKPINTKQLVQEAVSHVNSWASAWSKQNVSGYLNAYTTGFRPLNGLSNNAWQTQRNQRLTKPTFIKVKLNNIRTSLINADTAKVTFKQTYQSNTFKDTSKKQILLTRVNNAWRIKEERSL